MRAMILHQSKEALRLENVPIPEPVDKEVLIRVEACGVCRTDLHVWEGELAHPHLPLILGHQVVGTIVKQGAQARRFENGVRVGAPWLARSCQHCPYCLAGQENLCDHALYRGYQLNGGFAEYCLADEDYVFPIPEHYSSLHAAPLLCAGLIGYRSLRLAGEARKLGFYGFGAAAHLLLQVARHQGKEVYAFTRKGDEKAQAFARQLGAVWAGASEQPPPEPLDAALIFASAGYLVPLALQAVRKGGSVVCAGIYMSDIPSFPYSLLYGERVLRSVTNLTRQDGEEFFTLLFEKPIETTITVYDLEQANQALADLREGRLVGSAVLAIESH
ncbi:zinc-dependent alcohol dehydrogenase family protein [Candidatus Protochlamydia phocaeensis]|uniref:zinc-dependent alcohol dehydrogenase family protein n=1 Tax=Candidatus Protochlamydia phocaeensis TaxID=1414722 RepID=UPI000839A37E|nr:zinc-dependent alcohol dehydrogenase family protein [Candidatus Protochlamydia phocaeensis]